MGKETETPGAAAARTAARAVLAFAASLQPRTTSKPLDASSLAATRPMPVLAPVMRTVLLFLLLLSAAVAACALTTEGGEVLRLSGKE